MAGGEAVRPVRVEVGGEQARVQRFELQESHADALSDLPYFPINVATFSCARLVRPILVAACYAGGPHEQEGVVAVANAFLWMACIIGGLGAIVVSTPMREWMKKQGASPRFTWNLEPSALVLLSLAVFFDVIHQLFALGSWDYFWSTGVAKTGDNDEMLAFFLVLLHGIGLLGLIGIIAAYARCFRASWRKWNRGPPAGYADDHQPGKIGHLASQFVGWFLPSENEHSATDLEGGKARAAPGADGFIPGQVPTPARGNASKPEESGPREAAAASQPAPGAPRRSDGEDANARPSVGTPPRAWLWKGGEWIPVRVMRSMPDGNVAVRLPGGNVVNTQQELLRPRLDVDEEPPSSPPSVPQRGRESAGPGWQSSSERRRPSWSPGQAPRASSAAGPTARDSAGRRPSRPSSAPAGGRAAAAAVTEDDSEGAKWAAERMGRLRKELQALDDKSQAERRLALRQLQRELHPDKQPPEMRPYAQPLFMLVQKEWEVGEAVAKAAAERAAESST